MKAIAYQPEHLEKIQARMDGQGDCPKTILTAAFTLVHNDEVVAIIGGFPFVPGVIHFWALISEAVTACPKAFHKECLKIVAWYEQQPGIRRLQFEVRRDYAKGRSWARALGFRHEGLMKAWFSDGSDACLYGRATCQR